MRVNDGGIMAVSVTVRAGEGRGTTPILECQGCADATAHPASPRRDDVNGYTAFCLVSGYASIQTGMGRNVSY